MLLQDIPGAAVTVNELQAFLRLPEGQEDALLASSLRSATVMCEQFIGGALMRREFRETRDVEQPSVLLEARPVVSVASIQLLPANVLVDPAQYRVVVASDGKARVEGLPMSSRVEIVGIAGWAQDPNDVPEPLRHGIVRYAAQLFSQREASDLPVPRGISALWRPYRRGGLAS